VQHPAASSLPEVAEAESPGLEDATNDAYGGAHGEGIWLELARVIDSLRKEKLAKRETENLIVDNSTFHTSEIHPSFSNTILHKGTHWMSVAKRKVKFGLLGVGINDTSRALRHLLSPKAKMLPLPRSWLLLVAAD
jgi:hypothetical protein